MNKLFFLCLTSLFLVNCNQLPKEIKEETIFESKSPNLKNVLTKFEEHNKIVENIYKKDRTKLELYLQLNESDSIEKVPNFDDSPESYFSSYNIIRNNSGSIIYISESPCSDSGDWSIIYENYYDENGNLIAFVRKSSFFNSECAEVVHEKSEYFYDLERHLVKKTYEISDGDEKPLNYKECVFNYRYEYTKHLTLDDYLKTHKFKK